MGVSLLVEIVLFLSFLDSWAASYGISRPNLNVEFHNKVHKSIESRCVSDPFFDFGI